MPIDRDPGANYPSHEWETGCGYHACTPPIEELSADSDQTIAATIAKRMANFPKHLLTTQELRDVSKATAALRTALDVMPDDSAGRELVLHAQRQILRVLDNVNSRDTSWH